jgi:coproporphyrinogen III oxidase-like Fe-S oxidoreductase
MAEACFLALRCEEGLDPSGFEAEFGASPRDAFGAVIEGFLGQGLLDEAPGGRLRLSRRGRQLADTVCAGFV